MNNKHSTTNKIDPRILLGIKTVSIIGVAIVLLGIIYNVSNKSPKITTQSQSESSSNLAGKYTFQVGTPGVGMVAPSFELPAANNNHYSLTAQKGKTVLLFFQEGIMCPACWDQIRDIERNFKQFQALGIDQMVSISTDSIEALKQKQAFEKYQTPLLSDSDLKVSRTYTTNLYGMMGNSMNGHSFILVGADGKIIWRADYGSAPKYTMYVPIPNLLADLQQGIKQTSPVKQ